jgi:L-histidine Nalpha-methyltransferase
MDPRDTRLATTGQGRSVFAADVARGLTATPKQLDPKYFYDALGSALFEAICRLPWYGITRAEQTLLDRHASDIVERTGSLGLVVELGPGSGDKLVRLVEALPSGEPRVHLVDISLEALEAAQKALGARTRARVTTHAAPYEAGLAALAAGRASGEPVLVLFLGSNIGNFAPPAATLLLGQVREALRAGDWLLLGADLVKPAGELRLAYDDPLGLTAAFNKNVLLRINSELGGRFDLAAFAHEARWNAAASRVEMHLVSRAAQQVEVPGAGVTVHVEAGESIWTESSYKFEPEGLAALGAASGFQVSDQWVEAQARFALTLFEAV